MCARPYSCLPRVLDGPRDLATSRGQAPGQQGLTLVHFSVQRKHFLWDRGCVSGVFRGYLGGLRGFPGMYRVRLCVNHGSG